MHVPICSSNRGNFETDLADLTCKSRAIIFSQSSLFRSSLSSDWSFGTRYSDCSIRALNCLSRAEIGSRKKVKANEIPAPNCARLANALNVSKVVPREF